MCIPYARLLAPHILYTEVLYLALHVKVHLWLLPPTLQFVFLCVAERVVELKLRRSRYGRYWRALFLGLFQRRSIYSMYPVFYSFYNSPPPDKFKFTERRVA